MKYLWCIAVVLGFIALPAVAAPPVAGTYYSYDLPGGTFNAGRFSESWVDGARTGKWGTR